MNITTIIELLVTAITGGGLVAWFTLPEKKKAAQLENNAKLIQECYEHIEHLKKEMSEMETRYEKLIQRKDAEIETLRARVSELESKIEDLERKRNAKGQFVKKNK